MMTERAWMQATEEDNFTRRTRITGAPYRGDHMTDFRLLDAAEACFEVCPSTKNWTWIEKISATFVQHEDEKTPYCNTVATQKMTQIDTK